MNLRHRLPALLVTAFLIGLQPTQAAEPTSDVKIWPFFYHASDPVTSDTHTELLWPLCVCHQGPSYSAVQLLSFPQNFPTQYPHQFYLFWPFSGWRAGNGHDAWLFPFVWSNERHFVLFPVVWYGNDYAALFPAFYYDSDRGHTLNLALIQHNHWSETERLHALWPFLWWRNEQSATHRSRSYGALPVLWTLSDAQTTAYGTSTNDFYNLFLVNWRYRSTHYNRQPDGTIQNTTRAHDGLFPLFYASAADRVTIRNNSPVTNHTDSFCLVPYWQEHRTNANPEATGAQSLTASAHHVLFPFWWAWNRQQRDTVTEGRLLFPFWWQSEVVKKGELTESASFLVPVGAHLYKAGEYNTQNLLGPVFNRTVNPIQNHVRYDAFFPFFSLTLGANRNGGRVFPLAGREVQRAAYDNLWYLFPLGWDCQTQEGAAYRIDPAHHAVRDTPLFWALHDLERAPFVDRADCPDADPRSLTAFYPFYWSRRQADEQHLGVLPVQWSRTRRSGPDIYMDSVNPLLLSNHRSNLRNGVETYARQDWLFSLIAWGHGEQDYALRRVLPLFSYENRATSRHLASYVVPFSLDTSHAQDTNAPQDYSKLSVPFSFLPLFRSESSRAGTNRSSATSWLFPFYKRSRERTANEDVKKLSILWPLWNGEWRNDETRIRGLGGFSNYYEKDSNDFVEQRILYRLYSRRSRSWFSEQELMPFYSRQEREDGDSYWKFLGGLLGAESRAGRTFFRLFYIPIPTGSAPEQTETDQAARGTRHADLALNYLRHGRHDRASIEFTLAGTACSDDRDFQLAAAEAYLLADSRSLGDELRASVPTSLEPLVGKSGRFDAPIVQENLRALAITRFENAIQLGADKPETLRKIAAALAAGNHCQAALDKLTESYALQPRFTTGLDQMALLACLTRSPLVPDSCKDRNPKTDYAEQRNKLLTALQQRYPNSPTLILLEVMPESIHPYGSQFIAAGLSEDNAFSEATQRKLLRLEQGATNRPGAEELAWCAQNPGNQPFLSSAKIHSFLPALRDIETRRLPNLACAEQAAAILNRQAAWLADRNAYTNALALFPRIRQLVPLCCLACTDPEIRTTTIRNPAAAVIQTAMATLYRIHIQARKEPLAYIAEAEEWMHTACAHQREAIARALESVRFEQQYLKQWLVTPVSGFTAPTRSYTGAFFERYVDLDAFLARPDQCTVSVECILTAPEARPCVLRLGYDHLLSVELNGQPLFNGPPRTTAVRDEFTVLLNLVKGANRLKLIVSDDTLAFGFFARLSDPAGAWMKDVRIEPANVSPAPSARPGS